MRLVRSVQCQLDRLLAAGVPVTREADVRALQAMAATATELVEAVRLHAEDLSRRADDAPPDTPSSDTPGR